MGVMYTLLVLKKNDGLREKAVVAILHLRVD